MNIQNFYVEGLIDLMNDNSKFDEWKMIVEQLKLNGQKEFFNDNNIQIPSISMDNKLHEAFNLLYPIQNNIIKYNVSLIPLEILRIIKLCNDGKYFNSIEIWADDKKLNFVLVGHIGYWYESQFYIDSNSRLKDIKYSSMEDVINAKANHFDFYSEKKYLLVKWGKENLSLDELRDKAVIKYMRNEKAYLQSEIKTYQSNLDNVEERAIQRFKW